MDIDLGQYMSLFVEESREHLQNMNDSLLNLEKDISNMSLINEIFRVAHTLKGMSGTMGFTGMADLTHEMENVLDGVRSNKINITEEIIDILFECFDVLDELVNYIALNGEENNGDNNSLVNKLRNILEDNTDDENNEKVQSMEKDINLDDYVLNIVKEAKTKGLNAFKIGITLNSNCMLKSARAFIIFNTLESKGNIISSDPSVEDIEDEKFDLEFNIVYISEIDIDKLTEMLYGVSEVENVDVNILGDESIASQEKKEEKITLNDGHDKKANKTKEKPSSKKRNNKIGKTVRVDINRLDNLMNLVSELIIIKNRMDDLSGNSNREDMVQVIEYLERITTNLHDAVTKVRMVPIERVFNRFPRMVRDLSKDLDKKVNLQMYGENTEVDRTVIDEIGDPLVHIIRNSIDHGIEHPKDRVKLDKSEEGDIRLKAYPDGNNVVIEVSDDGQGIDSEKIKKKAVNKGLITDKEAEEMIEDEIKNLLFEPGFSTSEEITEVSGRGVGLDVVKNKIESINGTIELESEKNKGTRFIIRIPLTLAIIQALLIKLENETYAIPLSSITEIITVESDNIRNIQGQEIMLYRGKTIPIVRLDRLLGLQSADSEEEYIAVVVRKGEKQASLLVSSLIGQQEIVIKPLGKYLSKIKYFSGATILGNGNISLILDVNSLI